MTCWYCGDIYTELFSEKIHTPIHLMCLQLSIREADPDDKECPIMAKEFESELANAEPLTENFLWLYWAPGSFAAPGNNGVH